MKVYLMQHGDALSEEHTGPSIKQTREGYVERNSAEASRHAASTDGMWHSDKSRAAHVPKLTAHMCMARNSENDRGITPNDPIERLPQCYTADRS